MSQHIAGFLVNVRILFGPFLIETHVFRQSCTLSRQKQLQSCRCRKRPSLKWPERCRTVSKTEQKKHNSLPSITKNSLFSVGRYTNMHFPSSEADVAVPRCASRMKFADIQNYSGSEADEKGYW